MRNIIFKDFKNFGNRVEITTEIQKDGHKKESVLFFEFFKELDVPMEIIVLVLIRMFKFWDKIEVRQTVPINVAEIGKNFISSRTLLSFDKVDEKLKNIRYCKGDNLILCFTGGFDSLALSLTLPVNERKLVSVDFDGLWSKRERQWFNKFNTMVVKTNILKEVGYSEITFQACPSLLYANELNSSYFTLGNIIEMDDAKNIGKRYKRNFVFPGLRELYFTYGLSEVSTLKIIAKTHPELIIGSFESLADNWTEKYLRKYLLVKSLEITDGIKIDLPVDDKNLNFGMVRFGDRYPSSFLYIYFHKFCGADFASLYCKDAPEHILDFIKNHKLQFFNRVACNIFETMPRYFRNHFLWSLSNLDILPFNENDTKELTTMTRLIVQEKRS